MPFSLPRQSVHPKGGRQHSSSLASTRSSWPRPSAKASTSWNFCLRRGNGHRPVGDKLARPEGRLGQTRVRLRQVKGPLCWRSPCEKAGWNALPALVPVQAFELHGESGSNPRFQQVSAFHLISPGSASGSPASRVPSIIRLTTRALTPDRNSQRKKEEDRRFASISCTDRTIRTPGRPETPADRDQTRKGLQ